MFRASFPHINAIFIYFKEKTKIIRKFLQSLDGSAYLDSINSELHFRLAFEKVIRKFRFRLGERSFDGTRPDKIAFAKLLAIYHLPGWRQIALQTLLKVHQ